MKTESTDNGEALAAVVAIPIMAGSFVLSGYVLKTLWAWNISPTFNVAPLSISQAMGVGLTVAYLISKPKKKDDESCSDMLWRLIKFTIGETTVFLFAGWMIHYFS